MQVNTRNVILDILTEVNENGRYVNKVLNEALRKYQYLSHEERAFISQVVLGCVERKITLDYIINLFSKVKVNKMKPVIRNIMRMGTYQIIYMDKTGDFAACDEAVRLAAKRGFATLKGFVNGVLRNISRNKSDIKYPDKTSGDYLSVTYSTPQWICDMWVCAYGFDNAQRMLASQFETGPLTIRCNTSVLKPAKLAEKLALHNIKAVVRDDITEALQITGYDYLEGIDEFNQGLFTVQDLSSMLVRYAAAPRPDDVVIDVCAAPGGKSMHIVQCLTGKGYVDARDVSDAKTQIIRQNAGRMGITNIKVSTADALIPDDNMIQKADIVIADLPCSGLGVLNKKPDIKYHVTLESLKELAGLQRKILDTVNAYVRKSGTLIYSTCTVNPEENVQNALWFAAEHDFDIVNLAGRIPARLASCVDSNGFIQIMPGMFDNDFDGFFIAAFVRR